MRTRISSRAVDAAFGEDPRPPRPVPAAAEAGCGAGEGRGAPERDRAAASPRRRSTTAARDAGRAVDDAREADDAADRARCAALRAAHAVVPGVSADRARGGPERRTRGCDDGAEQPAVLFGADVGQPWAPQIRHGKRRQRFSRRPDFDRGGGPRRGPPKCRLEVRLRKIGRRPRDGGPQLRGPASSFTPSCLWSRALSSRADGATQPVREHGACAWTAS